MEPDLSDIKGDPYLNDWAEGSITTKTGKFEGLLLRFNIASHQVEHRRGTHTMTFNRDILDGFELYCDSQPRRFLRQGDDRVKKSSQAGFFEVVPLGTDSVQLFIRHLKNFYEADFGPYSIQERSEYRYEPVVFVERNGILNKVKLTRRFCQMTFGLSKEEVLRALEEKGISLDD